jgi:cbb3-type cytochrome oxidase cytochrome c subunit
MTETLDLRMQSFRVISQPEFTAEEIAAALESLFLKADAAQARWSLSDREARALLARFCREITALFALADSLDVRVEVEARLNLIA